MTNAEKFKEVFGFDLNTIYEEQDYDNDFEEKTFCNQITCEHCPFQFTNACVYHEPKIFWQSEYKEPKKDQMDVIFDKCKTEQRRLLGEINELVEYKKKVAEAIENIKADLDGVTLYECFNPNKAVENIIDKHTKELL